MSKTGSKGRLAGKSWIVILILAMVVVFLVLMANTFFGNPIRKQIAKSTCLDYFQGKYHEEFIVHEVKFALKLPGYVLVLSPQRDPQFRFSCNPNCEPICTSDEYGGKLASRTLVEQITGILEPAYPELALQISASEDPYTRYGGEAPDFFESDPTIRLTKNHQDLKIAWVDPVIQSDDFTQIAENMAGLIVARLPFINPDLQVTICVYPDAAAYETRYETNYFLFPTLILEE